MNQLKLINVSKEYKDKVANKKIDLVLDSGVYGLLGPNGAGKSTLMKQIVTVTSPTSGKILYNDKDIQTLDEKYRAIVGYLPQEFNAYKNFKARDFLMYMAALKGMDKATSKQRVDELLKLVGLSEVANKYVSKFSGGMKRRVGIAQALLNQPKILILDEPTAGLDPQERTRFRNLLSQIGKDTIVILSTHIISDIESVAKETIMIKEGQVFLRGTHQEILAKISGKAYVLETTDEALVAKIQDNYKVISVNRGVDTISVRFISESTPAVSGAEQVMPKFEDVYMFYFDLEDGQEG